MNIDCVIDHEPVPVDTFKHNWHVWDVRVQMKDGTEKTGFMEGDGHGLWALETFEEKEA
jgi:hypothetical protein